MGTKVSFPGLGIGVFDVDNVAFTIGEDFSVYWYGVIITSGIFLAFLYAIFRSKYENVNSDSLVDIALWTVILGVTGARLYYVLTSLDTYIPEPFNFVQFLKNVVNLRNGGLAIYGGIIGGCLGIIISTKIKKINTLQLMDMAGPGVFIGQLMGRWGNFFNGEAFGGIVSESHPLYFLRMGLISHNTVDDFGTYDMVYVHPTFLYESLWNLAGFILVNIVYKKKRFNGQIACIYLSWYGFGRMLIEGLRTDSLYVGPFRISQVVGMLCFVIFGGALIAGLIYSRKYDGECEMNKFDKWLKPAIVQHPVFFEKKADGESVNNGYAAETQITENNGQINQDSNDDENADRGTAEEKEDGTDN